MHTRSTRPKQPSAPSAEGEEEEEAAPAFALDDIAEVLEGPFKGMQGQVIAVDESGEEVTLALTVMGRDTPVSLPIEHCVNAAEAV